MSNRNYVYPQKTLTQSRSKFDLSHTHKTSWLHSKMIPYDLIEVLPGDTFSIDVASIIRMSTPIAPIMDNIVFHMAAYFIPNRLLYEHFEEVFGANKTGAWTADDNEYSIPLCSGLGVSSQTLGDYLGLPSVNKVGHVLNVSTLPGRAYYFVWNEFYRNQNVSAPVPVNFGELVSDAEGIVLADNIDGSIFEDGISSYEEAPLMPLGKYSDKYTKCLPEPQKHDPINIIPEDLRVSGLADIGFLNVSESNITTLGNTVVGLPLDGHESITIQPGFNKINGYSGSVPVSNLTSVAKSTPGVVGSNSMKAEVAAAAWNNINALRFAFQLQKFYEKDARYGSARFFEILNGHYGVTNPDLVLNRPQFLGEMNYRINVDQVLSMSGYASDSTTTVGAPGANSVTTHKGSLFTGSFTEPGYILIVGGCRHEHTYGQGCTPLWKRTDRLSFYDPVFANIGEQPVYADELFVGARNVAASTIFGYQEAWAEYRFLPDRVSGVLAPWASNNLGFWTLADKFDSVPLLNETFIYENRDSIKRALVTGETGPDYIGDFYFKTTCVREMPLFSIPGLVDHH